MGHMKRSNVTITGGGGRERKDEGRNGREEEGRVRLLLKYNPKLSSDNSAGFDLVENEEEYIVMRKESGL